MRRLIIGVRGLITSAYVNRVWIPKLICPLATISVLRSLGLLALGLFGVYSPPTAPLTVPPIVYLDPRANDFGLDCSIMELM